MNNQKERITKAMVSIPSSIFQKIRLKAFQEEKTKSQIVSEALIEYFKNRPALEDEHNEN